MTDRLSTLLHDEAGHLPVPDVPVERALAGGRAIRRRRRTRAVVSTAVAAVVVVAAGIAVVGLARSDRTPEPARLPDRAAYDRLGAWARGDEVHVGNHTVVVDGVEELAYTSVGVVVTSADGSRVLVGPDGEISRLDLDPDQRISLGRVWHDGIATDAAQPYLAYVRALDETTDQLAVVDLSTGQETAADEPFRVGKRSVGSVYSLWGDEVYYVHGRVGRMVDWRTGEQLPPPSGMAVIVGGHGHGATLEYDDEAGAWVVTSRTDGSTLLTVPVPDPASARASLSADGRYVAASNADGGFDVYGLANGEKLHHFADRVLTSYGWTPDGHLVGKAVQGKASEVEVCDPVTGACDGSGTVVGDPLTLPGSTAPAG